MLVKHIYKQLIFLFFAVSTLFSQNGFSQSENNLKIIQSKIFVSDQDKALEFYTETLGFVLKDDVSNEGYRWLTVVSADDLDGTQLILEKNDNPAAVNYQEAIYKQGTPATMFGTADVKEEYKKLKAKGVHFTMEPTDIGPATIAIFDDTCGNLIQIVQFH